MNEREQAAEMVKAAHKASLAHLALIDRLSDDVRVLEEVLPVKRAALARAREDHADYVAMVRESFDFFRSVSIGTERQAQAEVWDSIDGEAEPFAPNPYAS